MSSTRRCTRNSSKRGVALIVVLWVVLIASLIMLGMLKTARVNYSMAHSEVSMVQAHWLARAGIERAISVLSIDSMDVDHTGDYWYSDEWTFKQIELTDGYSFDVLAPADSPDDPSLIRFGMIDASSRINLNTAEPDQLSAVLDLNEAQIQSIVDWRDKDSKPLPGGAEQAYYARLDFPYNVRNGPLQTPREMLLIHQIDAAAYYGEDANGNGVLDENEDDGETYAPADDADGQLELGLAGLTSIYSFELNKTGQGNERVDINSANEQTLSTDLNLTEALAKAVVEKRGNEKFKRLMQLLDVTAKQDAASRNAGTTSGGGEEKKTNKFTLKWLAEHLDELTLSDEERLPGKINVNTASARVLMALPEMTRQTAQTIVNYRASERGAFYSVGELLFSQTVTEKQFKAMAEKVTVRSNVFEIRSRGRTPWGVEQTIVAVVDRTTDPISILYWYQSE
jgi:type II secretory pathway component PulK